MCDKNILIYNENCLLTLDRFDDYSIDVVLTSPPYNTNKKAGKSSTIQSASVAEGRYPHVRYDAFVDNIPNEDYIEFTVQLFRKMYNKLADYGCVLYNISYGSENTECMWRTVSAIIENTDFTVADTIIWKKKTAIPNNCSPNKLTRIVEYVVVFCKRSHLKDFFTNKRVVSVRSNGQKMYENVHNFIEAPNNDGACKLNKASYSTELCRKLLEFYAPAGGTVYDPFNGIGTTGNVCKGLGLNYRGSEISKAQCEYTLDRLGVADICELEIIGN